MGVMLGVVGISWFKHQVIELTVMVLLWCMMFLVVGISHKSNLFEFGLFSREGGCDQISKLIWNLFFFGLDIFQGKLGRMTKIRTF